MKIVLIGYREWALKAFSNFRNLKVLKTNEDLNFFIDEYKSEEDLCLLFAGWSQIIKSEIIDKFICISLHPSDLPRFRGGSPIQNQKIMESHELYFLIYLKNHHLTIDIHLFCKYLSYFLDSKIVK